MFKKLVFVLVLAFSVQASAGLGSFLKDAFKSFSKLVHKVVHVIVGSSYEPCRQANRDKREIVSERKGLELDLENNRAYLVDISGDYAFNDEVVRISDDLRVLDTVANFIADADTKLWDLYCTEEAQRAHKDGYEAGKQYYGWNKDLCNFYAPLRDRMMVYSDILNNDYRVAVSKSRELGPEVRQATRTIKQNIFDITVLLDEEVAGTVDANVCNQTKRKSQSQLDRMADNIGCDTLSWSNRTYSDSQYHAWTNEPGWLIETVYEAEETFWNDRTYQKVAQIDNLIAQRTVSIYEGRSEAYNTSIVLLREIANKIITKRGPTKMKCGDPINQNPDQKQGTNYGPCKSYGELQNILVPRLKVLEKYEQRFADAAERVANGLRHYERQERIAGSYLNESKQDLIDFRTDYGVCKKADR